jgi:carboxypeptidase family protein
VPRGGSISGTVVDETSGAPIHASITILDADGGWRGSAWTDVLGSYTVSGLVPGNMFVSVANTGPYWPELYDNVPCPVPYLCGVLPYDGTPVPVPLGGTVAGIDFALGTVSAVASGFYTVDPCRAVDTRGPDGPALAAGTERVFYLTGSCLGFSAAPRAVSLNVTVVGADAPGNVRLYAAGGPTPATSTLNYAAGVTRSNNAVVPLNAQGQVAVHVGQASGQAHLIIDVNGYFE